MPTTPLDLWGPLRVSVGQLVPAYTNYAPPREQAPAYQPHMSHVHCLACVRAFPLNSSCKLQPDRSTASLHIHKVVLGVATCSFSITSAQPRYLRYLARRVFPSGTKLLHTRIMWGRGNRRQLGVGAVVSPISKRPVIARTDPTLK
jgi:hypothetical protein